MIADTQYGYTNMGFGSDAGDGGALVAPTMIKEDQGVSLPDVATKVGQLVGPASSFLANIFKPVSTQSGTAGAAQGAPIAPQPHTGMSFGTKLALAGGGLLLFGGLFAFGSGRRK